MSDKTILENAAKLLLQHEPRLRTLKGTVKALRSAEILELKLEDDEIKCSVVICIGHLVVRAISKKTGQDVMLFDILRTDKRNLATHVELMLSDLQANNVEEEIDFFLLDAEDEAKGSTPNLNTMEVKNLEVLELDRIITFMKSTILSKLPFSRGKEVKLDWEGPGRYCTIEYDRVKILISFELGLLDGVLNFDVDFSITKWNGELKAFLKQNHLHESDLQFTFSFQN